MLALSKPSRAITRTVLSISVAAVSFTHSTKWSPPLQFPHSKCYFESKKYCKSRRNRILILHYDRFHGQPELCCCILIRIFAEFTTLFMVIIPCETPKSTGRAKILRFSPWLDFDFSLFCHGLQRSDAVLEGRRLLTPSKFLSGSWVFMISR